MLLTWPVRQDRDYTIRTATIQDIPAIVALLNNEHRGRLFGNIYSVGTFLSYLDTLSGIDAG